MYWKKLAGVSVAAILASGVAAPAFAKTFAYCSDSSPEGFDPAIYAGASTFDASAYPVYNTLIKFKPGTTETEPSLAQSWDISPDGKVYTFHLRKGVKFQTIDGYTPSRELNADDVVFSFDRQSDKNNPWHSYMAGVNYEYYNSMDLPHIVKSVEKVDDYTVKVTLTAPNAPFLADMAMPFMSIISKEYADTLAKAGRKQDLNNIPVGTGPFKFVAYQKDAVIRYARNPDYWGPAPKIDDLVYAITPDSSVRLQRLEANECQLMSYPAPADLDEIKKNPDLKMDSQPGLNVAYLAYNVTVKPFDDVRVRKAINMAINKKAIIDAVFQGTGAAATNPIPPTMWGYNKAVKDDEYNPDEARKLLKEAGVKNLSMDIWAMPVQRLYMPNARRTAEMMQSDLAKVGVKVNIVSYEWGEYLKRSTDKNRKGAVIIGWIGDNGDPDNFLGQLLSCQATGDGGSNISQWCDKKFTDLIIKARETTDQAERAKLYEQAQAEFKAQAPWDTLAHSIQYVPMRKDVTGFTISPLGGFNFSSVDISE